MTSTGVLSGLNVLDLSWGVAGPIAGMLFADNGAIVTRVEPPGGGRFRDMSGARVWHRGKRSAVIDLHQPAGRETLRRLASKADVLLESFSPGTMDEFGLGFDDLRADCPRLIYCSITGYGRFGQHSARPGYDALVAARTGHQWESRGVVGGTVAHLSGGPGILPGVSSPPGCWTGPDRDGPLFSGLPWPSLGAGYLAAIAISAALRARELTGRGQRVETSLLQGVLIGTASAWQRAEHSDADNYQSWVNDPRAPHGFFRTSDDQWIQQWMSLPSFLIGAASGDTLGRHEGVVPPSQAQDRIGPQADEMVILHHYNPLMAEAVSRFPAEDWVRLAGEVGVPLQRIRSPEEALRDEMLRADGCVVALPDPDFGEVLQVGSVYRLSECPITIDRPAPRLGEHTEDVLGESERDNDRVEVSEPRVPDLAHPLSGITVIDFGLAVAGPYGAQILSDLGATVIKVNRPGEEFWMSSTWAMLANRGKQSVGLNLKSPSSKEVLDRLIESADVIIHNMRYDAARRIGIDYDSVRELKPDIVYCHTRGHDRGPRENLPGNDQTGGALAGMQWVEGGLDNGGQPIWPCVSLGDPGNGLLAALGVVQAIYHRDRTGRGQFVDTAILYAQLVNTSAAWVSADGSAVADRPKLDAELLGWGPLYRLYETADGWLCIAVTDEAHWQALSKTVLAGSETAARCVTAEARRNLSDELTIDLQERFRTRPAADWFKLLDEAGVPCEISDPNFVHNFFDDPEMIEKGWVATYRHRILGRLQAAGTLFDFSDTTSRVAGPPFVPGQHTSEVLGGLGFDDDQIADLHKRGAVFTAD